MLASKAKRASYATSRMTIFHTAGCLTIQCSVSSFPQGYISFAAIRLGNRALSRCRGDHVRCSDEEEVYSLSSCVRISESSVRRFAVASGYRRSSFPSVSTIIWETMSRAFSLSSAGTIYHGALDVEQVSALLKRHFPVQQEWRSELPSKPVVL